MITIADLMTPEPLVVRLDTPIAECALLMTRFGHRHLPVVDDEGVLAGMVTDFAVFQRGGLVGDGKLWVPFEDGDESLTAADIADRVQVSASLDEPVEHAVRRMLASRQDFVVVLDERGHPAGLFTEHDGVRIAQSELLSSIDAEHIGSRPVRAVRPTDSAHAAWLIIMQYQVRHVVVVDEGLVVGVISVRDLIEDDVPRGRDLTCGEVLRRESVLTVPEGMPLRQVASLMIATKVGCLPVTDDAGRPTAVITRTDLIRALVGELQDEALFGGDDT